MKHTTPSYLQSLGRRESLRMGISWKGGMEKVGHELRFKRVIRRKGRKEGTRKGVTMK